MKNYIKYSTLALLTTSLMLACAKTREAAFPEAERDQVFAMSDFGSVNGEGSFSISTAEQKPLSATQQARALYEKGVVSVNPQSFSGSGRLRFLFEDLEVSGQPGQTLRLVFGLGKDFLTVYKVVGSPEELTAFELALIVSPEQVQIELQSQKTGEAVPARKKLEGTSALIPLFKYKIEDIGVVERQKNENKEETAVLKLRKTKFLMATHIKLKNEPAERIMILPSKAKKAEQEEVYMSQVIHGATMPAGILRNEFGVSTTLNESVPVTLSLTEKELLISEVMADKNAVPRFKHAITYVIPYLPSVEGESSANKELELQPLPVKSRLVRITKGAAAEVAEKTPAAATPAAK